MSELNVFQGVNAGYVAELYERYLRDPGSVDEGARALFERWAAKPPWGAAPQWGAVGPPVAVFAPQSAPAPAAPEHTNVAGAAAAELAQAIRLYGHRAARLDPLGSDPPGDPHLDASAHGIDEEDLARLPASVVGGPPDPDDHTAADAIARLRRIYSGATGYELAHVQSPEERAWLQEAIETGKYAPPRDPLDERHLLTRLTELSAFERFIHRAYPGATRFSIEGLGMMIPMLDEMVACAGERGTRTILLGMAHRGRLNVLAHVLGKPYERILAEFEGHVASRRRAPTDHGDEGWQGDVKYHAGARRAVRAGADGTVTVIMAPNPSHLEFVNPVVEGMARAADEDRARPGRPRQDEVASLAVLIHGDAAFPGQGVVAETLNLSRLPGYSTGGTLHLIANNQLGFTTEPHEGRSTLYASDLAKGFEIPIVHVNASDPIACVAAARLAVAYRARFRKDFLIDLVGYRRWGHNEGDEPSFTQPRMYAAIAEQPTVREEFAADLVERGVVGEGEPAEMLQAALDHFQELREAVRAQGEPTEEPPTPTPNGRPKAARARSTGVPRAKLAALNAALVTFPDGFSVNPKLERPLERRRAAFDKPDAPIDWGHAETLAFASILAEGTPVRLSGQDAVRGTFSQRHLTFYDANTGEGYTPLEHLPDVAASFDVYNSPLSETAVLGFEYGYAVQAPDALVLWEAQYGDFIDGAQVIVDEFVVSAQAKWGLQAGLVLLLPHGYEGQGPDHSSARIERFLELCAEENIRVCYPTTAAQYFHLLRRQAASLKTGPRPLVVMTPKSLLRHPLAEARAEELTAGSFRPVIDDDRAKESARRVVLCSGKIYADVAGDERRDESIALVRVEELYPFPADEVAAVLAKYGRAREVVWLQEEPRNMGAWTYVEGRLRELLGKRELIYMGRPPMASPAEGWMEAHKEAQRAIVDAVYEGVAVHAR